MVPISIHVPVQVAMDRMKKIKRQLSMTLRGGRGIDKTNGVPEQIGLDESGGGGGSDLGEAPTRVAPGELRSIRGPLSSAPGGCTLIILSSCPRLPHSASQTLVCIFPSSLSSISNTLSVLPSLYPGPKIGKSTLPIQLPQGSLPFSCTLVALSVSLDLPS